MELTTPRLTMPTKTLLDGARYVPHYLQSTEGILARWVLTRSFENPSNYPEFQDTDHWVREEV